MRHEPISSYWSAIEKAALSLGVRKDSVRKWRERGSVPHRWRLPIIVQTGGAIGPNDFLSLVKLPTVEHRP